MSVWAAAAAAALGPLPTRSSRCNVLAGAAPGTLLLAAAGGALPLALALPGEAAAALEAPAGCVAAAAVPAAWARGRAVLALAASGALLAAALPEATNDPAAASSPAWGGLGALPHAGDAAAGAGASLRPHPRRPWVAVHRGAGLAAAPLDPGTLAVGAAGLAVLDRVAAWAWLPAAAAPTLVALHAGGAGAVLAWGPGAAAPVSRPWQVLGSLAGARAMAPLGETLLAVLCEADQASLLASSSDLFDTEDLGRSSLLRGNLLLPRTDVTAMGACVHLLQLSDSGAHIVHTVPLPGMVTPDILAFGPGDSLWVASNTGAVLLRLPVNIDAKTIGSPIAIPLGGRDVIRGLAVTETDLALVTSDQPLFAPKPTQTVSEAVLLRLPWPALGISLPPRMAPAPGVSLAQPQASQPPSPSPPPSNPTKYAAVMAALSAVGEVDAFPALPLFGEQRVVGSLADMFKVHVATEDIPPRCAPAVKPILDSLPTVAAAVSDPAKIQPSPSVGLLGRMTALEEEVRARLLRIEEALGLPSWPTKF